MPRTEAQKRAEKTYRAKQSTFLIKWNDEMLSRIKAEAERQGTSMQEYVKRSLLNQLKEDRKSRTESED
jgi:predicted HicB family RNase H-like nuclease